MTRRVLEVERFHVYIDGLARSFQEKARGLSLPDPQERAGALGRYRDELVARVRARYRRLHKDFRGCADRSMASLGTMMEDFVAQAGQMGPIPAP